jgi:YVTN family beta-propeller protein
MTATLMRCAPWLLAAGLSGCNLAPGSQSAPRSASGTLLVLNKTDNSVSLIDAMTGDRIDDVPTGDGPHEVAVSPDGAVAVVTDYGRADAPGHTLTVIDLAASKVSDTIDLGPHGRPHGVQFLEDGRTIVVTAEASGSVLLVDVVGSRVLRAMPTLQAVSHMVVLDPDGSRAYVANIGSGSVSVLDLDRAYVVAQIPTAAGAEGLDLSPDGKELWVANRTADTLSVIDTHALAEVDTIRCGTGPIRIKFTPDGRRTLVSNAGSGDIAVFDVGTRREIGRIPLQYSALESTDRRLLDSEGKLDAPVPVGLLVSRDGTKAWVANTNADLVTVLDLGHLEVAGRIKAGREPDGLGWTPLTPMGL